MCKQVITYSFTFNYSITNLGRKFRIICPSSMMFYILCILSKMREVNKNVTMYCPPIGFRSKRNHWYNLKKIHNVGCKTVLVTHKNVQSTANTINLNIYIYTIKTRLKYIYMCICVYTLTYQKYSYRPKFPFTFSHIYLFIK